MLWTCEGFFFLGLLLERRHLVAALLHGPILKTTSEDCDRQTPEPPSDNLTVVI